MIDQDHAEFLDREVTRLRSDNEKLRAALEQAKTLLCEKYEFEEAAALVQLLRETANAQISGGTPSAESDCCAKE